MANNNQLSYQTATIDPTIAGYAARDPGFALGLLLGRGWVENYNERGIRKLQESLKGKDGLTPADANADAAVTNAAGGTPTVNTGAPAATGTANTVTASASADNAKPTPQIFSMNQNPVMAQVDPYKITPMAVQPSDVQKAVMENTIANASAPQAGDTGYKDALMARVRNILYDPNNQWAQSAARGAIYNKLKAMGDPGGGNPYAIGNYDDSSKNFSQQALAQSFANKWTPQATMNADGTVTQSAAPGYVSNNPLQGASMYAIQGNANQGIQSPDMNAQFRAYLNGETPQTAPVLDAVQAQQAAADNTQNVIPPQAKTSNFTDAEQDKKSDEPVQQEQASQEEPTVSKSETVATEQNSPNGKTVQSVLQNNVQPTPLKPFSVKDWIAQVTQAGIAQGRPMNQIQAVISRGLPAAQAAEDNYKKQAVDGLLNRIYNGDETTGGKNLLPTMENANTAVPKLMQTLNEIDSIDPERGAQIRAILPSYNTFLKENINNFNKARDVGYSIKLSDHSMENNIKQQKEMGLFNDERTKNMTQWKHAMSVAWQNEALANKANLIAKYSNGQITPDQAMQMLVMGSIGGKGNGGTNASGDVQKTDKGTLIINGNELSKTQTARSNELDADLQRLSEALKGYMASSTADDVKSGTSSNGKDNKDNLAKSINALNAYISALDDKDRALIPNSVWDGIQQQLYAANYIREHLAGNGKMENAIEYLKALTPETRQKYNIVT